LFSLNGIFTQQKQPKGVMNMVVDWSASTRGSEVYDLVDSGKSERILQASLIQACVIHTHLPLPILFWHKN
jgi:hypothetical protein